MVVVSDVAVEKALQAQWEWMYGSGTVLPSEEDATDEENALWADLREDVLRVLVAALPVIERELREQIDALREENARLRARVEELEAGLREMVGLDPVDAILDPPRPDTKETK